MLIINHPCEKNLKRKWEFEGHDPVKLKKYRRLNSWICSDCKKEKKNYKWLSSACETCKTQNCGKCLFECICCEESKCRECFSYDQDWTDDGQNPVLKEEFLCYDILIDDKCNSCQDSDFYGRDKSLCMDCKYFCFTCAKSYCITCINDENGKCPKVWDEEEHKLQLVKSMLKDK